MPPPATSPAATPPGAAPRFRTPAAETLLLWGAILLALVCFVLAAARRDPRPAWAGLAFVSVSVATQLVRRQFGSRLIRAEPFLGVPERLIGRREELDLLIKELRSSPLVWLVGEPGVGKSQLLRLGVVAGLASDRSLLPVNVATWGTRWARDVEAELARAFYAALSEDEREALRLVGPPDGDALGELLERTHHAIRRRPLLIFDQFEDYLAGHRDRLARGGVGRVLTVAELREKNEFWDQLARVLSRGRIHCLFAARPESLLWLSSFRFRDEVRVVLGRLPEEPVKQLFAELATEAVWRPARGFEALAKRATAGLCREGRGVLASELVAVMAALPGLKQLSPGGLARAGGVAGLIRRRVR